jgi:hypothetical protein
MQQPLPENRIQNLLGTYGALKQLGNIPNPVQIANSIMAVNTLVASASFSTKLPWRPPQWGAASNTTVDRSPVTMMSVQMEDGTSKNYYFDAVLRVQHSSKRQITEHPVQWGAAVADHSYKIPDRVSLEIGMSDSMQSFDVTQYSAGGGGKSVNAYREFIALQDSGQPLTLNTRLKRYENMVIEDIPTIDTYETVNTLKCTITFKQILVGKTGKVSKSLFKDATFDETKNGASASAVTNSRQQSLLRMSGRLF